MTLGSKEGNLKKKIELDKPQELLEGYNFNDHETIKSNHQRRGRRNRVGPRSLKEK